MYNIKTWYENSALSHWTHYQNEATQYNEGDQDYRGIYSWKFTLRAWKDKENRTAKWGSNCYRTHKETKRDYGKIEFMRLKRRKLGRKWSEKNKRKVKQEDGKHGKTSNERAVFVFYHSPYCMHIIRISVSWFNEWNSYWNFHWNWVRYRDESNRKKAKAKEINSTEPGHIWKISIFTSVFIASCYFFSIFDPIFLSLLSE